ncbi:hypothetical protein SUGI_0839580 [Cryptomeria japonica]|nr:hypothetical protein SUGI_0839580 [Cryptomeria japonica]
MDKHLIGLSNNAPSSKIVEVVIEALEKGDETLGRGTETIEKGSEILECVQKCNSSIVPFPFTSSSADDVLRQFLGLFNNSMSLVKHPQPSQDGVDFAKLFSVRRFGGDRVTVMKYEQGEKLVSRVVLPRNVVDKVILFVGSHMGIVTDNLEEWEFNPFHLSIESDELQGRGTTNCLDHVTFITELFGSLFDPLGSLFNFDNLLGDRRGMGVGMSDEDFAENVYFASIRHLFSEYRLMGAVTRDEVFDSNLI